MNEITATILLKRGREKPVRNRHPWIFSGAIETINGNPKTGDLVQIADAKGEALATAYYNPHSQIRARLLSWHVDEEINGRFWQNKIRRAVAGREWLANDESTTAYRLINAESDSLPGLIVDKYDDYLVMQLLTAGMDSRRDMIVEMLAELLSPKGIIERSDVPARQKEQLPQVKGLVWGDAPPTPMVVMENGRFFQVDLLEGHKTGLYLDQRENRTAVTQPAFVAGKEILNAFAYTGGFGTYAATNGAGNIVNLDSSIPALEIAESNMAHNKLDRPNDEYLAGDAFEVLRHYRDTGRQFDMVILDPPKFAHSRKDMDRATRGYKDLNWLALRLLRPGGLLATFSCSGRISPDLFQKVIFGAAVDARRDVQIIHTMGQAADHPVLLTFPEASYLKGLLCRVW